MHNSHANAFIILCANKNKMNFVSNILDNLLFDFLVRIVCCSLIRERLTELYSVGKDTRP